MYYCQSRYYNPRVGRFVSADKYFDAEYSETPLTSNVWAYAENNPVNLGDHDGESATAIILGLLAVGALLTAGGCAAQSKEPPPAKNTTTSTTTTNAPKATTTSPGIKSTKAYKDLYKKISSAKVDNKAALLNRAEVEIVARTIYGENTSNKTDQAAIARVMINRKAANSYEFRNKGTKNTYKNIVSYPGAFVACGKEQSRLDMSKNPGEWENAKHLAVLVCLNKKNEFKTVISSHRFFRTETSYKESTKRNVVDPKDGKKKDWIYMGTYKNGKKAYFEVTGKKIIYNTKDTKKIDRIYFNYKNNWIN